MAAFSEDDSLCNQPGHVVAAYLKEVGDAAGALALSTQGAVAQGAFGIWQSKAWQRTGCTVGFVSPGSGEALLPISGASGIDADPELIGRRLKITLDRLYVEDYPGLGEHRIVCEFAAKNQGQHEVEAVRFALAARVRDGSAAGFKGSPVFVGIAIGPDGLSFEGRMVNVGNSGDDWLLDALGSDTFKAGLSILTTAQPVLKPFVKLAADAVASSAKRKSNAQVHTFDIGLDFSGNATSSRLRLGSYVVVQGDDAGWDWSKLRLRRDSNSVEGDDGISLRSNYLIIGVSEATEEYRPPSPQAGAPRGSKASDPKRGLAAPKRR